MNLFSSSRILYPILLIEGFVSIGVEILTIRQLLPVAGGSVIVTSLIIGFFLLFLALGYQQGGYRLENPLLYLRRNFFISAIWLGIGLSYSFVLVFFYLVQKFTGPHILYPLILYLMVVIAPLIYLLGQTTPMTMNMIKQNALAGRIGGKALSLNTLGSFFGAVLSALVLMYYLGVAWTILIHALLLLFLTILLSPSRLSLAKSIFLAIGIIFGVYFINIKAEKNYFVFTNHYANYQILNAQNAPLHSGEKILMINEAASSYTNDQKQGFPYVETIKKILFQDMKLRYANILVLGAGGFSLSHESTYDNHFTYVDIDPQIKQAVIPRFTNAFNHEFIPDDARHYLSVVKKKYAAIVLDAYSDIKAIPSHLITYEFIQTIKMRLIPQGVAIFNVIASPTLSDPYSKHVDNTLRSVFKNCIAIPYTYSEKATNIVYVCSNSSNQSDQRIYTDNKNHSTTDSFYW